MSLWGLFWGLFSVYIVFECTATGMSNNGCYATRFEGRLSPRGIGIYWIYCSPHVYFGISYLCICEMNVLLCFDNLDRPFHATLFIVDIEHLCKQIKTNIWYIPQFISVTIMFIVKSLAYILFVKQFFRLRTNKTSKIWQYCPDSKVHGANMGPTWVLSAADGPHVGPMNVAIRVALHWEIHPCPCHDINMRKIHKPCLWNGGVHISCL